jgi:hypothetical protein
MNKRMIGVYLDGEERAALSQMAERERREMRDQAAAIIRRELERAGLLPTNTPTPITSAQVQEVTHDK